MDRITHGRVAKPGADGLIDQSLTNNHVSKRCKALYNNVLHTVRLNQRFGGDGDGCYNVINCVPWRG